MLLVVGPTAREAAAVLEAIRAPRERFAVGPYDAEAAATVTTVVSGAGPAAAAAATATALALGPYDAVLSVGVAAGFAGTTGLVVASEIVPADLGVAVGGRWQSGAGPVPTHDEPLAAALGAAYGPVLTLSETTATPARREALLGRFPTALAEAGEGYGTACAATAFGIPCHEVRVICRATGDASRPTAEVPGALALLTASVPALIEHLEP